MPTLNDSLARAMIDEIEREYSVECSSIERAAAGEARDIVRAARGAARQRMRTALAAMRLEEKCRLGEASARRQSLLAAKEHAETSELLRRTCPQLIETVLLRWNVVDSRHDWVRSAARHAEQRLLSGAWKVEHPASFEDADRRCFLSALRSADAGDVTFAIDENLTAGLRVRAAGAVLDATPEALLADRPQTEASLLAEIARQSLGPSAALRRAT